MGCSRVLWDVPGVFRGCSGDVPGCSGAVPGLFRGCSGFYRHPDLRLICKVSGVSVNHVSFNDQMCVSCIHNIFVRNRFELAFINTIEIVLQLYLFPLLIEVACFVIKSAIIIFVFLLRKSTKVCSHL